MTYDLLDQVVERLRLSEGELRGVAERADISYDTVLRIKNRENDPGYSKVARLAEILGVRPQCPNCSD